MQQLYSALCEDKIKSFLVQNNLVTAKSPYICAMKIAVPILLLLLWTSCRQPGSQQPLPEANDMLIADDARLRFLTQKEGRDAILVDSVNRFFETLNAWDISLQLKADLRSRNDSLLRSQYKNALRQDVSEFTAEEKLLLADASLRAYRNLKHINAELFPKEINFIKIKGGQFGRTIFYTRQNCIMVPEARLQRALAGDKDDFFTTIKHEIFHIISRYKPALRHKLYARIGFDTIANLVIPDSLQHRLLRNPDGAEHRYAVRLNDTLTGVLLSYSRPFVMNQDDDLYFSHFKTDFFAITQKEGQWYVQTDSSGENTLGNTWEAPFYQKVGTNTDYTIHPDEILADNFALLLNREDSVKVGIDPAGLSLLNDLKTILQKHKAKLQN